MSRTGAFGVQFFGMYLLCLQAINALMLPGLWKIFPSETESD